MLLVTWGGISPVLTHVDDSVRSVLRVPFQGEFRRIRS